MSNPTTNVRISTIAEPVNRMHECLPLGMCTSRVWLGGHSPFGLALPNATPSACQLYGPRGVWLDRDRLIVCDSGNHRILIWNTVPRSDHEPADIVLGQPNFESEGASAAGRGPENGMYLPTGVLVIQNQLVVADAWHHRILVWNSIPTRSDTAPDYAIGQPDLYSIEPNRGRSPDLNGLYWPYGIAYIAGTFWVADTGNRRVLGWRGLPNVDQAATVVLGQDDGFSNEENRGGGVTSASFRWPHAICGDANTLFVADAGNHRVLVWQGPLEHDRPADGVLGQPDTETNLESPYQCQGSGRVRFPYAATAEGNLLAVADTGNNRVLFWRLPVTNRGSVAIDVLGQMDFGANGENQWQSVRHDTLCWPYGLSMCNGQIAVADSGNNRVMLWDCSPLVATPSFNPQPQAR